MDGGALPRNPWRSGRLCVWSSPRGLDAFVCQLLEPRPCHRRGFSRWLLTATHSSIFDFPYGSASKESACNAGDLGSILGLGRSLGEGKDSPVQYSGQENSMDCIFCGVTKSQIWQSDFHLTSFHIPSYVRFKSFIHFFKLSFVFIIEFYELHILPSFIKCMVCSPCLWLALSIPWWCLAKSNFNFD